MQMAAYASSSDEHRANASTPLYSGAQVKYDASSSALLPYHDHNAVPSNPFSPSSHAEIDSLIDTDVMNSASVYAAHAYNSNRSRSLIETSFRESPSPSPGESFTDLDTRPLLASYPECARCSLTQTRYTCSATHSTEAITGSPLSESSRKPSVMRGETTRPSDPFQDQSSLAFDGATSPPNETRTSRLKKRRTIESLGMNNVRKEHREALQGYNQPIPRTGDTKSGRSSSASSFGSRVISKLKLTQERSSKFLYGLRGRSPKSALNDPQYMKEKKPGLARLRGSGADDFSIFDYIGHEAAPEILQYYLDLQKPYRNINGAPELPEQSSAPPIPPRHPDHTYEPAKFSASSTVCSTAGSANSTNTSSSSTSNNTTVFTTHQIVSDQDSPRVCKILLDQLPLNDDVQIAISLRARLQKTNTWFQPVAKGRNRDLPPWA